MSGWHGRGVERGKGGRGRGRDAAYVKRVSSSGGGRLLLMMMVMLMLLVLEVREGD